MFKKLLIAVVVLGCLGLAGFGILAWRPTIAPIARPAPDSFAAELIAKGEALAGGGYCAECHTTKGGQNFAGGYAFATPFGVIYSTNITPDPETRSCAGAAERHPVPVQHPLFAGGVETAVLPAWPL